MSEDKICFRCKRPIDCNKDAYYAFIEIEGGKKVKTDFAHKTCWNQFLDSIKSVGQAKGMLNQLQGTLRNMGLLPAQEVVLT